MIAVIFVRMMVELLCMVVLVVAGLIYVGIGDNRKAIKIAAICGGIAWIVRPNRDDRALFAQYQAQYEPPR